MLEGRRRG